jgi:hypothetical protein
MTPDDINTFNFKGKNALYEAIMMHLEAFVEGEVLAVQDRDNIGEGRIHSAGRLAGLTDYRDHIKWLKDQATRQ